MTQNLLLREAHSLSAISKLEPAFPYAATLLVYTVIERCLKIYLLTNIDTLPEKIYNYQIPIQISNGRPKMTLADCRGSRKLLQSYLTNCPLGVLEKIYKIRPSRYSPARNGVFHSNLYIDDQLDVEEYEIRNRMNHDMLREAKRHLIEASDLYFNQRIIETNGLLQFASLAEKDASENDNQLI